jgi:hypothetical protein
MGSLAWLLVLPLVLVTAGRGWSQEPAKPKDDALDSLLEKLAEPAAKGDSKGPAIKRKDDAKKAQSKGAQKPATKADARPSKPDAKPGGGAPAIAPKDQDLDSFLEKLGETKDAPTAEDQPRQGGAGGMPEKQPGPPRPDPSKKSDADRLAGQDKDLDTRLEELTGKKRKKPHSDEERGGAVGEIIKEMREVEQRLGKPDSSEETRSKQKQIVKRIETLIEQVKKSESSAGRLMRRQRRQQGQKPGDQDGDQQGALARGAGPMKPAKPTEQHSNAGGKDIWGHLPAELRSVMENSFKEQSLATQAELISRYFLSVGKGKLQREE